MTIMSTLINANVMRCTYTMSFRLLLHCVVRFIMPSNISFMWKYHRLIYFKTTRSRSHISQSDLSILKYWHKSNRFYQIRLSQFFKHRHKNTLLFHILRCITRFKRVTIIHIFSIRSKPTSSYLFPSVNCVDRQACNYTSVKDPNCLPKSTKQQHG